MLRETLYFDEVIYKLDGLLVYRNIREDPIIQEFKELCSMIVSDQTLKGAYEKYFSFASALVAIAEERGYKGSIFRQYVMDAFFHDVNPFSLACECGRTVVGTTLFEMALKDTAAMRYLMDFDIKNMCGNIGYDEKLYDYIPSHKQEQAHLEQLSSCTKEIDMLNCLMWYYENMGCGILANHSLFGLNSAGELTAHNIPSFTEANVFGYRQQKTELLTNTRAFVEGKPAQNILLLGTAGNGKHAFVYGVAHSFYDKGLRVIEISKLEIPLIPKLTESLQNRGKKIIFFVSGITRAEFEQQYTYLKDILNPNARPNNMLMYIVCEEETFSPADGFGLTLTFGEMGESDYLEMVTALAKSHLLNVPESFLKEQALAWKNERNSANGKTAKQFIESVIWEVNRN